jgi:hypothetical protein
LPARPNPVSYPLKKKGDRPWKLARKRRFGAG